MISEVTFAHRFSTLWNSLTPTMEHFVRSLNLNLYERYSEPVPTNTPSEARALVSEAAFLSFLRYLETGRKQTMSQVFEQFGQDILASAQKRIGHLYSAENVTNICKRDTIEAIELAKSINEYFSQVEPDKTVEVEPEFQGAGFIDSCKGDFGVNATIIEVKMVDRNFRATDVRQLLTYCALDYANDERWIETCCLLNPRKGIYWKESVERLCKLASGAGPESLFQDLIYAICSGEVSR